MNKEKLEERIDLIILNTIMEGPGEVGVSSYDYINEAISWAQSDVFFEGKTAEEILEIFREYELWNSFEEECANLNPPA